MALLTTVIARSAGFVGASLSGVRPGLMPGLTVVRRVLVPAFIRGVVVHREARHVGVVAVAAIVGLVV